MLPDPCQPHNKGLEATLTKQERRTPQYTTRLEDVPMVRA